VHFTLHLKNGLRLHLNQTDSFILCVSASSSSARGSTLTISDESFPSRSAPAEISFAKTSNEQDRWVFHDNLSTAQDVRTLVDSSYDKMGRDELFAPVFNDFAHVDGSRI